MKILLCGGNGQLGKEVQTLAKKQGLNLNTVDLPEINICDPKTIETTFDRYLPDVLVNVAAYTAVDKAESDKDLAYKVNAEGSGNLAQVAAKHDCRFLHVSTDYVFGNGFNQPIKEDALTQPLNVYGASKLAGEKLIQDYYAAGSLIVRTASLHGQYGANFVHTMLKLFKERDKISVVSDQIMSPTWAGWLAQVLLRLANDTCVGVVHASSGEAISWFDFTKAIYELSGCREQVEISPINATDYPRAAKRASYSVLNVDKLRTLTSKEFVIGWKSGLNGHLKDLGIISA